MGDSLREYDAAESLRVLPSGPAFNSAHPCRWLEIVDQALPANPSQAIVPSTLAKYVRYFSEGEEAFWQACRGYDSVSIVADMKTAGRRSGR